jgi:hypothetical protein
MESGTCESCGAEATDLVVVHRLYVTPESWDTQRQVRRVEEVERWCFPCRTMYPHEVEDPEEEREG